MKKCIKYLSLVLCLALSIGILSAGTIFAAEIGEEGEKKVIACLCPSISIDYYKQIFYGAIQEAEAKGYDIHIITGMTSIEAQVSTIDDLVEAGVDGIILSPMDSYGIATALDRCKEAGVIFISNDEAYGTDSIPDCRIINQNKAVATLCAESFAKSMNYEGTVICIRASKGVAVYDEKVDAWLEVFDKYGMEVLAVQEAETNASSGQQVMSDLLQQYPDVDGVITFMEAQLQGAMIAMEEAGLEIGTDIKVASNNYSVELSQDIRDGRCSGAIYSWGGMFGAWGVDMIDKKLNGEAIPEYIAQPYTFVDQSNIEEFDALSSKAHNFNFDSYITN